MTFHPPCYGRVSLSLCAFHRNRHCTMVSMEGRSRNMQQLINREKDRRDLRDSSTPIMVISGIYYICGVCQILNFFYHSKATLNLSYYVCLSFKRLPKWDKLTGSRSRDPSVITDWPRAEPEPASHVPSRLCACCCLRVGVEAKVAGWVVSKGLFKAKIYD